MSELASNVITVAQAENLYQAYIQEQIRREKPAFRNLPVLVVYDPIKGKSVNLSYSEMLTQVQRRTSLGVNEAIRHARALGYMVVQ